MQCTVCSEVPTHPICHQRLGEQMITWFNENKLPGLAREVEDSVKTMNYMAPINSCIFCHVEDLRMCSHCFTKEFYDRVLEEAKSKEEEFRVAFCYEWPTYFP